MRRGGFGAGQRVLRAGMTGLMGPERAQWGSGSWHVNGCRRICALDLVHACERACDEEGERQRGGGDGVS